MAVVIQYAHQPASGTTSRCSTPVKLPVYEPLCLPDYVPRTSPSVEYIFGKHGDSPYSQQYEESPYSHYSSGKDSQYSHEARTLEGAERPASTTSPRTSANRPPKAKANHAKLHRKRGPNPSSNYTTSRPKTKNKTSVGEEPSVLSSLAETSSLELCPRPPASSRSPTRERLRNNLRRFSVQKELEELTLDLSMTAEENAERLGLAIRASDPGSPLTGAATPSSLYRVQLQSHIRSRSNGSQVSLGSGLFTPTAPYSFNMQHTAQPYSPPTSYTPEDETHPSTLLAAASVDDDSNTPPVEILSADAIKEEVEGDERPTQTNNSSSEDEEQQAPSSSISISKTESASHSPPSLLSKATTLESRSCITPSTSDLNFRLRSLSRRSTDVSSSDIGTPRSVSSFSFRPKTKDDFDPVQRAASIAAARRAFAEREEEKTRKHEDRLRKASERQHRKHNSSRKQSLDNGSSGESVSSSSGHSRSTSLDGGVAGQQDGLYGREYSQLTPVPSHALPTTISTINHVAIRRTKTSRKKSKAKSRQRSKSFSSSYGGAGGLGGLSGLSATAAANAATSTTSATTSTKKSGNSRRTPKSIYLRSFIWLKMRMLNLARQSRKSSSSSSSSSSSMTGGGGAGGSSSSTAGSWKNKSINMTGHSS